MTNLTIDRNYLRQTLADLVHINSINPSLVPGSAGEGEVAAYVTGAMQRLGMMVTRHEPEPNRVSVVGTLPGTSNGRSLMLNGHIDTVGVENMPQPFSGEIRDDRLYGRGAYDMKGSIAAMLAAVKALREVNLTLKGDLILATVADEEYASIGTADIASRYKPAAAIVTEPTELQLAVAHKGFVWLEVTVSGKAAHGSRPQLGIDANLKMGRFLHELERLEQELHARKPHPLIGPPTLHAAMLNGGREMSVIADRSELRIERRTIPGETEAGVVAELRALLDRLSVSDENFHAAVKSFFAREPFEVATAAPIVEAVQAAAADVLQRPIEPNGVSFWTDAALLAAAGIPTVVFGPIGAGAHAAEEWIDLQSVEQSALIYARTALAYCG
ncbi:MAG TPA: ArgE/DapE family deacylase [Anaerolineae bacterium]|nr:ArgE/DapE family deacylase [Anaerolineae bacterium]